MTALLRLAKLHLNMLQNLGTISLGQMKWSSFIHPFVSSFCSLIILFIVARGELENIPAVKGQEAGFTMERLPTHIRENMETNNQASLIKS